MSIIKNEWATGDVVTAEKLNVMQYAMVEVAQDTYGQTILKATAKELADALESGIVVFAGSYGGSDGFFGSNYGIVGNHSRNAEDGYSFQAFMFSGTVSKPVTQYTYFASSDDEYPVVSMN